MKPLDALTAIRGSIGLATLFAPRLVTWSIASPRAPREELRYVMRIWAARNLAFAVATRAAPSDAALGSWLRANVAIDVLDLASGVVYARRVRPGVRGAAFATLPPALAAGLGVAAAARGPDGGGSRTGEDDPTARSTP